MHYRFLIFGFSFCAMNSSWFSFFSLFLFGGDIPAFERISIHLKKGEIFDSKGLNCPTDPFILREIYFFSLLFCVCVRRLRKNQRKTCLGFEIQPVTVKCIFYIIRRVKLQVKSYRH